MGVLPFKNICPRVLKTLDEGLNMLTDVVLIRAGSDGQGVCTRERGFRVAPLFIGVWAAGQQPGEVAFSGDLASQ